MKIDKRFSEVTGKRGVIEGLVEENERQILAHLLRMGVSRNAGPREVFSSLVSKVEGDEERLREALGNPNASKPDDLKRTLQVIQDVTGKHVGFFLKEEKAREFLTSEPPKNALKYLGYSSAEEMLAKEDVFQVYSSLRFIENEEWMNGVFFKQYEGLTPDDFEEREMRLQVLDPKWVKAAQGFLEHKWHNVSHLKEMGIVFVIPATFGIAGEILRMVSLIFHYLSEVPYYSDMFRRIATNPTIFAKSFVSLLRGDVLDKKMEEGEKSLWFVIQKYLAKDDPNEWRLFVPHINPEAVHWMRAEEHLVEIGKKLDGDHDDLGFWLHQDWVGDFFKDKDGNEILISFDLVDVVMSLVKKREHVKFLYHHQEALWNKVFMEYFGREELVRRSQDYLLKGYFEI
ncbi:MAG: hypothetical protein Q7J22_00250 [Candidatus Wolfebacteria bacterium]|nr:hypothetical protein [Candidatus Wolfebacteria bacterium]